MGWYLTSLLLCLLEQLIEVSIPRHLILLKIQHCFLFLFKGVPSETKLLIFQSIIFILKYFHHWAPRCLRDNEETLHVLFFKPGGWAKPVVVV